MLQKYTQKARPVTKSSSPCLSAHRHLLRARLRSTRHPRRLRRRSSRRRDFPAVLAGAAVMMLVQDSDLPSARLVWLVSPFHLVRRRRLMTHQMRRARCRVLRPFCCAVLRGRRRRVSPDRRGCRGSGWSGSRSRRRLVRAIFLSVRDNRTILGDLPRQTWRTAGCWLSVSTNRQ